MHANRVHVTLVELHSFAAELSVASDDPCRLTENPYILEGDHFGFCPHIWRTSCQLAFALHDESLQLYCLVGVVSVSAFEFIGKRNSIPFLQRHLSLNRLVVSQSEFLKMSAMFGKTFNRRDFVVRLLNCCTSRHLSLLWLQRRPPPSQSSVIRT